MKTALAGGLLVAILGACGASGRGRPTSTARAVTEASGVQRVDVEAHSYYFEPNRVVVQAGRPVELRIHNAAWVIPHNLTVEGTPIDVDVAPGGESRVRIRALPPGEYHIHCDVGDHAHRGMVGVLVVQPTEAVARR